MKVVSPKVFPREAHLQVHVLHGYQPALHTRLYRSHTRVPPGHPGIHGPEPGVHIVVTDEKAGPGKGGECLRVPSTTHVRVPSKLGPRGRGRSQPPDTGKGGRRDVGLTIKATGFGPRAGARFPWRVRPGGGQGGSVSKGHEEPRPPDTENVCPHGEGPQGGVTSDAAEAAA